jgi:hypothetical protein
MTPAGQGETLFGRGDRFTGTQAQRELEIRVLACIIVF